MRRQIYHEETIHRLARWTLLSFLITFILLRVLVYIIMSDKLTMLYVFIDGRHIHHFSEGIFMLALIAGYTIFMNPKGRLLALLASCYGVAMALTFDEFGMWLNLDVTYWQQISIDMVLIILSLFGLLAYAPPWRELKLKNFTALIVTLLLYVIVVCSGASHLDAVYGTKLQHLQTYGRCR